MSARRNSGRPVVARPARRRRRARHLLDLYDAEDYTPPEWHVDALCRDHDNVDFLSRDATVQARAFQVCGRCPVRVACLDMALADPFLVGVWGGTDDAARRAIRRARGMGAAP
jgi:WhiB family transcriptional regulator, redox-sensing transcriptional regulator